MKIATAITNINNRIKKADKSINKKDSNTEDLKLAMKALQAIQDIKKIQGQYHDAVVETMEIESVIERFEDN